MEQQNHNNNSRSPSQPASARWRWAGRTAFVLIAAVGALALWLILSLALPNKDFRYPNDNMTVVSNETTSQGIPVVRSDDPLVINLDFCNNGTNTQTDRNMDLYAAVDRKLPEEISRVGSFELPYVQSFAGDINREPGCVEDVDQPVNLPDYLDQNSFYTFRITTSWRVNAIRIDEDSITSEIFYLAEPDAVLP